MIQGVLPRLHSQLPEAAFIFGAWLFTDGSGGNTKRTLDASPLPKSHNDISLTRSNTGLYALVIRNGCKFAVAAQVNVSAATPGTPANSRNIDIGLPVTTTTAGLTVTTIPVTIREDDTASGLADPNSGATLQAVIWLSR